MVNKKITIGLLAIIIAATYITVTLTGENVRLKVANDKSTFFVYENNSWVVSGVEYDRLYNGTKLIARTSSTIESFNVSDLFTIVRTSYYANGASVISTYQFNGSVMNKELFPISHTATIVNGTGLVYEYYVNKLDYSGITRDATSPESFGHSMKVTWQDGYSSAKVYKSGYLKVRYSVLSDNQNISVRLFDPSYSILSYTNISADIRYRESSTNYNGFQMKINISSLYSYENITNINLYIKIQPVGAYETGQNLWRISDQTWDESSSESTINSQPKYNYTLEDLSGTDPGYVYISLFDIIQACMVANEQNCTIRFESQSYTTGAVENIIDDTSLYSGYSMQTSFFYSSESTGNEPYLNITYEVPLRWSLNSTNTTYAGMYVSHNLFWNTSSSLSGHIFGFCNGTWNGTNCLTYYSVNDCYQESANTTNQTGIDGDCSQYYTGTYVFSGTQINPANSYDGNWSTAGGPNAAGAYVNVTYKKPTGAVTTAIWKVKGTGTNNYTVLSSCWSFNSTHLKFQIKQISSSSTSMTAYCINASGVQSLGTISTQPFEEAIYWNMSVASGGWVNNSYVAMTGMTNWSNTTKFTNTTIGAFVAWKDWANNTNATTNQSNVFSYNTTDGTAPTITIVSPTNISYYTLPVNINFTTNEDVLWCNFNLDGGTNTTLSNSSKTNWYSQTNSSLTLGHTYQLNAFCNDTAGNIGFNNTIWFTYPLPALSINYSIWNGTSWLIYNSSSATSPFFFVCEEDATDCEPVNQNTAGSQCITRACNNGTLNGTSISIKINQTCSGISLKADDDYTAAGALVLNDSYQDIHGVLNISECIDVCMWLDLSNPETPCNVKPTVIIA